eukprot:COSAG04_NODE_123_length_24709_cov_113.457294_8_plen_139_part_00
MRVTVPAICSLSALPAMFSISRIDAEASFSSGGRTSGKHLGGTSQTSKPCTAHAAHATAMFSIAVSSESSGLSKSDVSRAASSSMSSVAHTDSPIRQPSVCSAMQPDTHSSRSDDASSELRSSLTQPNAVTSSSLISA